jgi:tetratricopeptide (TPR) repeat protein
MSLLSDVLSQEGRYSQAEAVYRQAYQIQVRTLGAQDPQTLETLGNLGFAYLKEKRFGQAELLLRQALEDETRAFGARSANALWTMAKLTAVYQAEGKYAEAEDLNRRELAIEPDDPIYLNLGAWLFLTARDQRLRQPKEALNLSRHAVKQAPDNVDDLNTLGLAEVRNGLWDEAIATLDKCVEGHKGADASDFLFLAMAYQGRGDRADAEKNYKRGAELARKPAATNAELRMIWTEAASALGKPAPKVQAAKATAS